MALINGTLNNNILDGTIAADTINGLAGNDQLTGGGGNDTLDGGEGQDKATFSGTVSEYLLGTQGGFLTVTDQQAANGDEGTDQLTGIEQLQFSDALLTVTSGEFRVNSMAAGDQGPSFVTALADGGFLVTWTSNGQDGDLGGIYAQRYDASGQAVGGEFRVNSTTVDDQSAPALTALADGGFLVTWTSDGQDGFFRGIYAQRYDAGGAPVGGEFRVNSTTVHDQSEPAVTALADGGIVVTWTSNGQDGSQGGIYAQRYNAGGQAVGGEFRVNSTTVNGQSAPAVTALADGDFVVTWSSFGQDGSFTGIYAQRYDAGGASVGGEFRVNSTTADWQVEPAVMALADGGFVVTWSSFGPDVSVFDIYAQRYDAAGAPVGGEFRVNTWTFAYQFESAVTALADGGFVVTWTSSDQDGSYGGIYAQRYNAGGQAVGGEFRVNSTTAHNQADPAVSALADGGFVVTWASPQDGESFDIYAQRYDADGTPVGGGFTVTGTSAADQLRVGTHELLTVDGWAGDDTLTGGAGADILVGGPGHDSLAGGAGNDQLIGGAGNDTLDGGTGMDTMAGGIGSDTYVVNTLSDVVTELADQDSDLIQSSLTYSLVDTDGAGFNGGNVESLQLTGTAHLNGTGNALDNILTGNAGNNILNGAGGVDTVSYSNATASVTVSLAMTTAQTTGFGSDTLSNFENLTGSNYNDTLTGNAGNNVLTGGIGNDTLNGGPGTDIMAGGAGNDTYIVNTLSDVVSELAGQGTDLIQAAISYSLVDTDGAGPNGGQVENLRLTGTAHLNGTGNALNNILYANAGNNVLNGGAGTDTASYSYATVGVTVSLAVTTAQTTGGSGSDTLSNLENLTGSNYNDTLSGNAGNNVLTGGTGTDIMAGGAGNDIYVINTLSDVVTELASQGTDLIQSGITYSLVDTDGAGLNGGQVENLRLTGSGHINGTGNALNNVLYANAGNNVLNGGAGTDTVSYQYATAGVTVSLAVTTAQATGGSGSDTLVSIENLIGSNFSDQLTGNGANNVLTGGAGLDTLTGGTGNDRFDYNAVTESLVGVSRDKIIGFVGNGALAGDQIDLTTIDANSLVTGNQAFTYIGNAAFSAAGQLRYAGGVLQGSTDGDTAAEFEIQLVGTPALSVGVSGPDILL